MRPSLPVQVSVRTVDGEPERGELDEHGPGGQCGRLPAGLRRPSFSRASGALPTLPCASLASYPSRVNGGARASALGKRRSPLAREIGLLGVRSETPAAGLSYKFPPETESRILGKRSPHLTTRCQFEKLL